MDTVRYTIAQLRTKADELRWMIQYRAPLSMSDRNKRECEDLIEALNTFYVRAME